MTAPDALREALDRITTYLLDARDSNEQQGDRLVEIRTEVDALQVLVSPLAATPPASAERDHVAEHEREVVDAAKEVARYWTPAIDAMAGIGGIHALDRLRDAVAALPRAAEAREPEPDRGWSPRSKSTS